MKWKDLLWDGVSRFQAGVVVEISSPDENTRFAILQAKSQEKGHIINQEILKFIAQKFKGSIRDMIGVLNQVIARLELTNNIPT